MGGAIRQDARKVDVQAAQVFESRGEDQPFQIEPLTEFDEIQPRVPRVLHGIPPILHEAPMPFFMLQEPSYEDDFLLTDMKRLIKTDGMRSHHPEVRQVVFDSFEKHPELLKHYMRS
jgi:hypothetical protein